MLSLLTIQSIVTTNFKVRAHVKEYALLLTFDSIFTLAKDIRGAFKKSVAFDIRATATQPKRIIFFYIISLFRNALWPVVL